MIKMFPESQIIRINDNVFVKKLETGFQPWFQVEQQYFQISREVDTEEEARWVADMFIKALNNYKTVR